MGEAAQGRQLLFVLVCFFQGFGRCTPTSATQFLGRWVRRLPEQVLAPPWDPAFQRNQKGKRCVSLCSFHPYVEINRP